MDHAGEPAVLPLRPLTVGELLDAAVALLRRHGTVLLPVAAILAAGEQLLLAPLRVAAHADPPAYLTDGSHLGRYWLLLAVGAASEVVVIALLGGLTARAAGAAVLGRHPTRRALLDPRGGRFGAVVLVAGAAGTIMLVAALAGPLWFIAYALVGLAVPALVLDRTGPGRALARGAALACRAGLRAGAIRLLGYLTWLTIRVALGLGAISALEVVRVDERSWAPFASAAAWCMVNMLVYATLACLDAVLHLETRMRTEGLDILLSRAGRRGSLTPAVLVAQR